MVNSSYCLFLACSSMLFILISGGCIPCKRTNCLKRIVLCVLKQCTSSKMNFKVVNPFEKRIVLAHLTCYLQARTSRETMEGLSNAALADGPSLCCSSPYSELHLPCVWQICLLGVLLLTFLHHHVHLNVTNSAYCSMLSTARNPHPAPTHAPHPQPCTDCLYFYKTK